MDQTAKDKLEHSLYLQYEYIYTHYEKGMTQFNTALATLDDCVESIETIMNMPGLKNSLKKSFN
jgi:hypothetical protein